MFLSIVSAALNSVPQPPACSERSPQEWKANNEEQNKMERKDRTAAWKNLVFSTDRSRKRKSDGIH